jgi:hypothetical protein
LDDDDADAVRGGPNYDYSLTEAGQNFSRYLTQYRPGDKKFVDCRQDDPEVLACKRRITEAFEEMRTFPGQQAIEGLWADAVRDLGRLRRLEGVR